MSLLTVVQDVCAFVGVERPTSVIAGINANRTMQEMLALANEAAKAVAYDEREWTELTVDLSLPQSGLSADGSSSYVTLPDNYKRMLLTANVRRMNYPVLPLMFISDFEYWVARRARFIVDPRGEWIINRGRIYVVPKLATIPSASMWLTSHNYAVGDLAFDTINVTTWRAAIAHTSPPVGTFEIARAANPTYWTLVVNELLNFIYLDKNCINLAGGGVGDAFTADGDTFRLDERLLKLCMIWRWKQSKGSPYAEDMSNYEIALSRVAGADKPAPIIVGRHPISSTANVAIPWPPGWGPQ